ncbi:Protein of uncharacterised function (DUF3761) [Yersinia bercovieri]|uniref:DUF3761 domain-containing protein n=1 Tax=Yersinia bercovieri TaxID=634 RepID=UPI00061B9FBE|nr:DUF3761 domain-containing protein [Yersinia bercovieri]CNF70036.1 Protein of uncharacterised function (DUF3761) [Yersinia bercovieri]
MCINRMLSILVLLSTVLIIGPVNAAQTKATAAVDPASAANLVQDPNGIKPTVKSPRKPRTNASEAEVSGLPATVKVPASTRKSHSSVLSAETTPAIPAPITVKPTTPATPLPATVKPTASTPSVPRVAASPASGNIPSGATARCQDGTYSYSQQHSGACSRHKGVDSWLQQ